MNPLPASVLRAGTAMVAGLALAACADLSGLGASSTFQCKAPPGVPCLSISGVDANHRQGTLPGQRPAPPAAASAPAAATAATQERPALSAAPAAAPPPAAGARPSRSPVLGALRSDPALIRLWIAPWEDSDGDLNDQGFVYLQIDTGRWLIQHNRASIVRDYAPRRPATAAATAAAPVAAASAAGGAP